MLVEEFVSKFKEELKAKIASFPNKPCMAIIQVGDNPASNAYIKGKLKDSEELGIKANLIKLDETISEGQLLNEIDMINKDPSVNGLIVQLPLPKTIDKKKVMLAIDPKKDIDGFHPLSTFTPCTPKGIITYLKSENIDLTSKNVVIINRSEIVGRPLANYLITHDNCNVTVLNSRTKNDDLRNFIKNADLIVVGVGKKYFINSSYEFKSSAVLVDVGINREDGVLYGDCEPNLKVALQTRVPKGVGLLTRISLITNLLEAFKNGI